MSSVPQNIPPHYIVEVEGTLWDKGDDGVKTSRAFRTSIPVPIKAKAEVWVKRYNAATQRYEEHKEVEELNINDYGIRSYLKKSGKLKTRLSKLEKDNQLQYVNITHLRTIHIVNVKASHPGVDLPSDPSALNLTQLKSLVKTMGWHIDLHFFNTVQLLREAIVNYKEDPKGYDAYEMRIKRVKGRTSAFGSVSDELDEYYEGQARQGGIQSQSEESGTKRPTKRVKQQDNYDDI